MPDPISTRFLSFLRIRPGGKRDFTLFLSKKYRDELLAIVFVVLLGSVFMTASATQRSSMPIPYQGRLLDSNYAPKADGTYYFRFLIYDALTAGTCVWSNGTSETHATNCAAATGTATAISATVSRGLFTTLLGSGGTLSTTHNPEISSSITNNFNSGTYYLEVRACGTDSTCANPETLSPRKQLAGALFSYNSDFLDGIDSTSFAILAGQSSGQILIGGTGTTDDLTLRTTSGAGTTGADMIFQTGNNGATEAMRILNDGMVTIGRATITNTADTASSQIAIFEGDRATVADGDEAYLTFRLSDSAWNQDEGARITWKATTVASGATQDTDLIFSALINNVLTESFRIDGSVGGYVGINQQAPSDFLDVTGGIRTTGATGNANVTGGLMDWNNGTRIFAYLATGGIIQFYTNPNTGNVAERMRLLSTGVLSINGTAAYGRLGELFEINTSENYGGAAFNTWSASSSSHRPIIDFQRSKSATIGTHSRVDSGDGLGGLYFSGSNGTSFVEAAAMLATVDGTTGVGTDMPGRLEFYTTPDESGQLTKRMTILNSGVVTIGGTLNTAYGRNNQLLEINTSADYGGIALNTWATTTAAQSPLLDFNRSRSATIGTHSRVDSGDGLGLMIFRGSDGTAFRDAASIEVYVDGSTGPLGADMPGRIVFKTTPDNSATLVERMRIGSDGAVKITALESGSVKTVCTGATDTTGTLSVGASASACDSSDLRLKTNIVPLTEEMNVLDSLKNLHGVYFNWKTDVEKRKDLKKTRRFGLIAQDVGKVFPELVSTNKDGMKGLEYDKLSAYLIEVAKAQQAILAPFAESIMIDKDGRVGIGTNTPTATVDIYEKQFSDDGIGARVLGLSSAVSSGDEPNYTIYQGKATTSELTPIATVNRLAVEPDTLYSVEAKIVQRNPLNGNGGSYALRGVFKTNTSSPSIITQASSSIDVIFQDNTAATPMFDVSTNGILKINVVGNWTEKNVWNSTVFVHTVKN